MPCLARNAATAGSSRRTVLSAGILMVAMMCPALEVFRSPDGFEQELDDFDLADGFRQGAAPSVQPVAPQEERVAAGIVRQHATHLARQPDHVLIVFEDWNPLAMFVCGDARQSLEHFVALDGQTAFGGGAVGEDGAPDGMRV